MLLQPMQHLQQAAVAAACPFSSAAGAKKTENNMQLQFYADPCEPDIDADLRAKERDPREHPDAQYMSTTQKGHISPSIRAELVLWMDAFARHLGDLPQGTLCRAVAYLDRVLTVRPVPSHDEALRLVAAAIVSLAAKYEETSSERRLDADAEVVEEFVGTTVAAVEAMERELVMDLDCVMDGPTAFTFVERFTRFFKRKDEFLVRTLALRLVDLTLPEFRFVGKILPSAVAASALFLARQILAVPLSNHPEELTGYKAVELMGCIEAMAMLMPEPKP
jgi:cyclin A